MPAILDVRRRNVAMVLGIVAVVAFAFFVPVIPMWILTFSNPSSLATIWTYGYGSITYYLFGLGGTYHSGTYAFTMGK